MKLTVQKEAIIEGLQKAASIIPSRAGAAYLRSIWLRAADNTLSLMATDANLEFTGIYPAEVAEPGLTGVQGRLFVDLVRQLPNGPLDITLGENDSTLRLVQGRRTYKLPVSSRDWFQEFEAFPEGEGVIWTGNIFSEYLDRVMFCIAEEDSMDALGCLYLKSRGDGHIHMCGLNGHQFALVSFINDALAACLPENGLLVQRKYLNDIRKWLSPDEFELRITDKRLYLRKEDGSELLSVPRALYDYPDYKIFMDKLDADDVTRLELPRKETCDALGRLQVFNTEQDRGVGFDLSADEARLSVQGGELGSARENIESTYEGGLDRIAFPTKNLLEIFGHFLSDNVKLCLTAAEGPCGITGDEDSGYLVIIMPMKVASGSYFGDDE